MTLGQVPTIDLPMDLITKRLHVSGLTPAITSSDLSARLSSFGTVKSLHGFGQLDGVGQPRHFAYVTIETTKPQLARCLNVLSGSTWKGTKLRIGDAKPDFRERLAKERSEMEDEPPKKKRRRAHATYAADMSLVTTPADAAARAGWRVTPLGRIVRPVRIRPARPLPPVLKSTTTKKGEVGDRKRRKEKAPPLRARRRTIDPTLWGSTHLKGVFLDIEGGVQRTRDDPEVLVEMEEDEDAIDSDTSEAVAPVEEVMAFEEKSASKPIEEPNILAEPSKSILQNPSVVDITEEKTHSLALLQSLFGHAEDAWMGRESISDLDEQELTSHRAVGGGEGDTEVEEVPRDVDGDDVVIHPETVQVVEPTPQKVPEQAQPTQPAQKKLKDLFAPREEEAGFSLLGHLDLDLDLDLELEEAFPLSAPPPIHAPLTDQPFPVPVLSTPLDPRQPLFFACMAPKQEQGWRSAGFFRTGTEADIRARWEASRVELTREWKRRHREAGKLSRRRRGGVGEGE